MTIFTAALKVGLWWGETISDKLTRRRFVRMLRRARLDHASALLPSREPCEFCMTEKDPFEPCLTPRGKHRVGFEIYSGPDNRGRFEYLKFWYDSSTHRQRTEDFFAEAPADHPLWKAALDDYRKARQ